MTAPVLDPWTPQDLPAPPPPAPPAPRRRSRAAALVLAGAVAGAAAGGGTAALVSRSPGAPAAGISRTTSAPAAGAAGSAERAAAVIAPSVVTIAVTGTSTAGAFGRAQTVSDTGSGIVLRADGYVLTNNHVVAAAVGGGTVSVTTSDGTTYRATIVGTDPTSDLAVLKVTGAAGLTPATFADSEELKVGQPVLAVGAPLGLSNTVTEGIVSTLHRPVRTGQAGVSDQAVLDAVQTDAAINPGNSGGALVDLAGNVVGVNTAIASTGDTGGGQSGNIGVGFAIPSDDATKVADQLIATGRATHPQLGVSVADQASATDGTPGLGARLQAVTPGGPAASAGLQPGDVVTRIDDRAVTDADSLIVAVRAYDPGRTVTVTYTRDGQTRTARATLSTATG